MKIRPLSAPITVSLNVTNRCNLRCRHCYLASGEASYEEISTDEWLSLIHDLADCKVFNVFINGGEPLVREDIFVLLDELARHPIGVTLFTNATLVTEETADKLGECCLRGISVSLDGSKPKIHDRLRGEGTFLKTVAGIERLVRRGLKVGISTVVTRFNLSDLPAIVKLARELGARGIVVNELRALGRAASNELSTSKLQDREVAETLLTLEEEHGDFVRSTYSGRARIYRSDPPPDAQARNLASCGAAKASCSIRPDGWVIPCNFLWGMKCGNVRDEDFITIWRHSSGMQQFRALSNLTVDDVAECRNCRYKSVCDAGCRAMAYATYGSFTARDPFCWYDGK
jgi:SynChlorMet cassette radical SAM/SPASM protein ScmE